MNNNERNPCSLTHSRSPRALSGGRSSRWRQSHFPILEVFLDNNQKRGLVRCLMRMFGFGIQFYKGGEDEETPEMAWTTVEKFAKDNKIPIQDVFNLMDQMGISKSNIVDRFSEFFTAVGDLVSGNTLSPFPERAAQVLANDPAPQTAPSENMVDPDPEAVTEKVAPPVWTT